MTENLQDVYPDTRFDLIIASECMYYFTNEERADILNQFSKAMQPSGVLYVNSPTYDISIYSEYKNIPKDRDGMVSVDRSGSISNALRVCLPRSISEMREMYSLFDIIDIMTTDERLYSDIPAIEYHLLARKGM